jgi:hypothetical protein
MASDTRTLAGNARTHRCLLAWLCLKGRAMSDTPLQFFSDPRKKAMDHLNAECFALEQLAKQYGHPEIQHALFRVRVHEIGGAETFLRGQIRREVDAAASGVDSSDGGQKK